MRRCLNIQTAKIESIDEFANNDTAFFTIYATDFFKRSKCSCSYFAKRKLCEHTMGFAIKKGILNAPNEAKNLKIGQKRKPGRPSKATPALECQN